VNIEQGRIILPTTTLRSRIFVVCCLGILAAADAFSQDVEPRVLSPAPVGTNIAGLTVGHSWGAVLLDKTVSVENLDGSTTALALSYTRYVNLLGLTSRFTGAIRLATGEWSALVEQRGEETSVKLTGLGDGTLAMLVFLVGAPAMTSAEFHDYRRNTLFGFNIRVSMPIGQYEQDRAINLGSNRWQVTPALALSHRMGRWTAEAYAGLWLFSDNTALLGDNVLSQDPMLGFQLNLVYSIKPRLWLATGMRQTAIGKTTLNGVPQDNAAENTRLGLVLGFPIGGGFTVKLNGTTGLSTSTGNDFDTITAQVFYAW